MTCKMVSIRLILEKKKRKKERKAWCCVAEEGDHRVQTLATDLVAWEFNVAAS